MSYRGAHRVAHTEVEATLFVHRIMQPRKLRQRGPVVVKGVVTETVVGTARGVQKWDDIYYYLILLFVSIVQYQN